MTFLLQLGISELFYLEYRQNLVSLYSLDTWSFQKTAKQAIWQLDSYTSYSKLETLTSP